MLGVLFGDQGVQVEAMGQLLQGEYDTSASLKSCRSLVRLDQGLKVDITGTWRYGSKGAYRIFRREGETLFCEEELEGVLVKTGDVFEAALTNTRHGGLRGYIRLRVFSGKLLSSIRSTQDDQWGKETIAERDGVRPITLWSMGGPCSTPWQATPREWPAQQAREERQHMLKQRLEDLVMELFTVQDLNSDGVLQEEELVSLNVKIAMLHYGKDVEKTPVREKYRSVFRDQLDLEGKPVGVAIFRDYIFKVLLQVDPDVAAQELILEQWINEANVARNIFHCKSFWSSSDPTVVNSPCSLTTSSPRACLEVVEDRMPLS
jgi:hypothetical protein